MSLHNILYLSKFTNNIVYTYTTTFCIFSSDTLQVLMSVCPTISELRYYRCWHPCWNDINYKFPKNYFDNKTKYVI